MTLAPKPRSEKNFVYHLGCVAEQLKSVYQHLKPEQNSTAFETIWAAAAQVRADPESVAQNCRVAKPVDIMHLILVSCAYATHAGWKHCENRLDTAWTSLAKAQYYAGAVLYAKALELAWPDIEQVTAQTAVADIRSSGGKAKNAGWWRIEEEAVRLVKKRGEQGERWGSERKMAVSIEPDLLPFALREVPKLSQERYVQTVSDRLKRRSADIGIFLKKRKTTP